MRLSALRTPPRSGAITPVLSASGRSTPQDAPTPTGRDSSKSVFNTPDKFLGRAGPSSSKSPRLKSPEDKKQREHGRLCVCEICTCGLHACHCKPKVPFEGEVTSHVMHCELALPSDLPSPPKLLTTRPHEPFEGQSSYKCDFTMKELPTPSPSEPFAVDPPVPLQGESSYKRDFTAKDPVPQSPSPRNRSKPPQPFHGDTSYREHYAEKALPSKLPRREAGSCKQGCRREEPFEGTTTYKSEFVEKELQREHPMTNVPDTHVPFVGESSYKCAYTAKDLPAPLPVKPRVKTSQAFFGETTYRAQFPKRELPQKSKRQKSAPAQARRTEEDSFDGMSTYRSMYTEKPLCFDPPQEIVAQPVIPFAGESSYKREYTEKELVIKLPIERPSKAPQPFYGETSYSKEYYQKQLPPQAKQSRSAASNSPRPWAEPLNGMSRYKQDFDEKQLPYEPAKPPYTIERSPPLGGESSYKHDYTEKPLHFENLPGPSSKPRQQFYGETSYNTEFTHKMSPRGAAVAKSPRGEQPRPWKEPLDSVSTYRSNYVLHSPCGEPASHPKPISHVADTRDFQTTYGNTYVPKDSAPLCPVTHMPSRPRFAPEGRGHIYWDTEATRWC